jgi:ABC-type glycerol-3-phosphate transport system permease component
MIKRSASGVAADTVVIILLLLFSIICIYPFYYIIIYSFSDPQQASKGVFLWPAGFSLVNYAKVLTQKLIYSSALISVLRTASGTAITVFCSSLFAYVVTKRELPFRKVIYRGAIITMYISAGLIPYYLTIKAYGLRDSFLVYIIPGALSAS